MKKIQEKDVIEMIDNLRDTMISISKKSYDEKIAWINKNDIHNKKHFSCIVESSKKIKINISFDIDTAK